MKVFKVTYQTFRSNSSFGHLTTGYGVVNLEKIFSTKEKAEEFRKKKQDAAIELGVIGDLSTNITETEIE